MTNVNNDGVAVNEILEKTLIDSLENIEDIMKKTNQGGKMTYIEFALLITLSNYALIQLREKSKKVESNI